MKSRLGYISEEESPAMSQAETAAFIAECDLRAQQANESIVLRAFSFVKDIFGRGKVKKVIQQAADVVTIVLVNLTRSSSTSSQENSTRALNHYEEAVNKFEYRLSELKEYMECAQKEYEKWSSEEKILEIQLGHIMNRMRNPNYHTHEMRLPEYIEDLRRMKAAIQRLKTQVYNTRRDNENKVDEYGEQIEEINHHLENLKKVYEEYRDCESKIADLEKANKPENKTKLDNAWYQLAILKGQLIQLEKIEDALETKKLNHVLRELNYLLDHKKQEFDRIEECGNIMEIQTLRENIAELENQKKKTMNRLCVLEWLTKPPITQEQEGYREKWNHYTKLFAPNPKKDKELQEYKSLKSRGDRCMIIVKQVSISWVFFCYTKDETHGVRFFGAGDLPTVQAAQQKQLETGNSSQIGFVLKEDWPKIRSLLSQRMIDATYGNYLKKLKITPSETECNNIKLWFTNRIEIYLSKLDLLTSTYSDLQVIFKPKPSEEFDESKPKINKPEHLREGMIRMTGKMTWGKREDVFDMKWLLDGDFNPIPTIYIDINRLEEWTLQVVRGQKEQSRMSWYNLFQDVQKPEQSWASIQSMIICREYNPGEPAKVIDRINADIPTLQAGYVLAPPQI